MLVPVSVLSFSVGLANTAAVAQTPDLGTAPRGQSEPAAPATKEAPNDNALDEIIVSAQKHDQRYQDVPVPVAVIKASELEDWRIPPQLSRLSYRGGC